MYQNQMGMMDWHDGWAWLMQLDGYLNHVIAISLFYNLTVLKINTAVHIIKAIQRNSIVIQILVFCYKS